MIYFIIMQSGVWCLIENLQMAGAEALSVVMDYVSAIYGALRKRLKVTRVGDSPEVRFIELFSNRHFIFTGSISIVWKNCLYFHLFFMHFSCIFAPSTSYFTISWFSLQFPLSFQFTSLMIHSRLQRNSMPRMHHQWIHMCTRFRLARYRMSFVNIFASFPWSHPTLCKCFAQNAQSLVLKPQTFLEPDWKFFRMRWNHICKLLFTLNAF